MTRQCRIGGRPSSGSRHAAAPPPPDPNPGVPIRRDSQNPATGVACPPESMGRPARLSGPGVPVRFPWRNDAPPTRAVFPAAARPPATSARRAPHALSGCDPPSLQPQDHPGRLHPRRPGPRSAGRVRLLDHPAGKQAHRAGRSGRPGPALRSRPPPRALDRATGVHRRLARPAASGRSAGTRGRDPRPLRGAAGQLTARPASTTACSPWPGWPARFFTGATAAGSARPAAAAPGASPAASGPAARPVPGNTSRASIRPSSCS